MVILQHGAVVVQQGDLRAGHDVEIVRRPGVFEVVRNGRYQHGEYLQVGQPVLRRTEKCEYDNYNIITCPRRLNNKYRNAIRTQNTK